MNKFASFFIISAILFTNMACSHKMGTLQYISSREIDFSKKYKPIEGTKTGTSSQFRTLFSLIRIGSPKIEKALENAIKDEGEGEFMHNATVKCFHFNFLLFSVSGIKIKGELMKPSSLPEKLIQSK